MKRLLPSSTAAAALLAGALFLSASGGAVAGSMVTGKQIKDGSISAKDIKSKSLTPGLFAPSTTSTLVGPPGTPGSPGANGVSGYEVITHSSPYYNDSNEISFTISCPAGKVWVGGAASLEGINPAGTYTTTSVQSASAWHFTGAGPGTGSRRLTAWLSCAKAA